MMEALDAIDLPINDLVHGDRLCSCTMHKHIIETYYHSIIDAILFADSFLPRKLPRFQKPFWSTHLTDLKQNSIDCFIVWNSHGKPRSGPIYHCMRDCSFKYKRAIANAKRDFEKSKNDALYNDLLSHDSNSFWKSWRQRNN